MYPIWLQFDHCLGSALQAESSWPRRTVKYGNVYFDECFIAPNEQKGAADQITSSSAEEAFDEDEALRNDLLKYRKKIEPILKDINRSILADQLLEEFIRRKPTRRNEFLKFPLWLRDQIDIGQGRFLDEILDIVEEFAI